MYDSSSERGSSRSNISSKTKKFLKRNIFHFHPEYEFNERFRLKVAIHIRVRFPQGSA
jgi:hypothetical protein